MIRTIDIEINAANPNMPLVPFEAFVASPASVRVRNVPRQIGEWKLTKVFVTATMPDNAIISKECKLVGGVWVGTISGSSLPGVSANGFAITANGVDEDGNAVTGYTLGRGDVVILDADGTITVGETTYYVHIVATTPTNPKKGDLDLSTMKLYDGAAWRSLGGGGGDMSHSEFAALPSADLDPEETGLTEICTLMNQMKNLLRPAATCLAALAMFAANGASYTTNKLVNLKGASNVVTAVSFDGLVSSNEAATIASAAASSAVSAYATDDAATFAGTAANASGMASGPISIQNEGGVWTLIDQYGEWAYRSGTIAIRSEIPTDSTVSGWGYIKSYAETDPESLHLAATNAFASGIVATADANAAAIVDGVMEYALTNLTGTTVSLASGRIGNVTLDAATSNLTVNLDFSTNTDRSGDAMLYLVNRANTYLAIGPADAVTPIGYQASDAMKAGTNIVMVTRLVYDGGKSVVNVAIKEVK